MKNNKGFSLTEIIVTIMIIAVLSAITGPIYNSYSTKSKAAEGYLLLGTIKDAQMKRYNDAGAFFCYGDAWGKTRTCFDETLGIDARANKYYTAFTPGYNSVDNPTSVQFRAIVSGKDVKAIAMLYNITTGTKFY